VEGDRLRWVRCNQNTIRAELYANVRDALAVDGPRDRPLGRAMVLPATFTGSPRFMQKNYLDAMTIVTRLGRPDLFLTFTANPNWEEISRELLPGQTAADRPDIVARVFYLKLKCFLDDLRARKFFGNVVGHMWTMEYQKRGLPHAHICIILEVKLNTVEQVRVIPSLPPLLPT
jgi:hypothetical protein